MLSCYQIHYLSFKKVPSTFIVLAHSACNAVQLMWRHAKINHPDDFLDRFYYDCRVKGCYVECLTSLSPSYIRGLESRKPGY